MKAWVNGQLLEENAANISLFDRSYLYGEGVFETLRCYQGRPAFLERHVQRLQKNLKALEIPYRLSEKEMLSAILELLEANQLKEAVVRITISSVGASFGVDRPKDPKTNITLFLSKPTLNPKLFETGVKVLPSADLVNDNPKVAGIKSTSYITKMLARLEASKADAYETLLKNREGHWVEGSRTNFFIVLDHVVITPPLEDGILNGITREVTLEILKEKTIPHREGHVTDLMLQNAEEIFLTGSTSEVMPVCEIIGVCQKKVVKNSMTRKLQEEYRSLLFNSRSG